MKNTRRYIKITVQILCIAFTYNSIFATEAKTEFSTKTGIKGGPQKVEEIHYKSIKKRKKPQKADIDYAFYSEINPEGYCTISKRYLSDDMLLEKTIFSYNEDNNLVNVNSYNSDDSLKWQRVYVYNEQGKITRREDICKDGACYEKEIYKYIDNLIYVYFYDINGIMKYYITNENDSLKHEQIQYSSDGKAISKRQNEFNGNGKMISSRRWHVPENNLQEETIYRYDNNGNLLEVQYDNNKSTYRYDSKGYLLEYAYKNFEGDYKYKYTYNDIGLLKEEFLYKDEILYHKTTYKYDSKENWIEKIIYENDNFKKVIQRRIQYYR